MWYQWNIPPVESFFFRSANSGELQSTLFARNDWLLLSNCLMNVIMKSNIINVGSSFHHGNHLAAFVSGRLLRFHIPKFHQITVTCWYVLPSDLVNTFYLATYFHTHWFIKAKGVAFIVARATIMQHIISQPWLWFTWDEIRFPCHPRHCQLWFTWDEVGFPCHPRHCQLWFTIGLCCCIHILLHRHWRLYIELAMVHACRVKITAFLNDTENLYILPQDTSL